MPDDMEWYDEAQRQHDRLKAMSREEIIAELNKPMAAKFRAKDYGATTDAFIDFHKGKK